MPGYAYPATPTVDLVEDHHGNPVADPYRWLEDTDDPDTAAWVKAQNELTEGFLEKVPAREQIRARLTELWNYPKVGVPFERGERWFQNRNAGLQDQPVLVVWDRPATPDDASAEGRVLLDPNVLSEDDTVAVTQMTVSDDGEMLVYATSEAGSDWLTWHVRDVATGVDTADRIEWSKSCRASLRKDRSGFYYCANEPPVPGREYLDKTRVRRVLFHRLGTEQAEDELVFAAPEEPEWLPDATVTDDGRFLIVSISRGTAPESQLWVLDLADTAEPATGLRPLVPDFGSIVEAVATVGSTFYLLTDHEAERRRIVAVDFDRPDRDHWREVVPESADTLRDAHWFGGRLVCHYLHDAHSVVRVHELDGTHVRDIPLPGIASLEGIEGRHDRDLVHLLATSFTESGSLWLHDLGSGQTALVRPSGCRIDPAAYVTEQVSVTRPTEHVSRSS